VRPRSNAAAPAALLLGALALLAIPAGVAASWYVPRVQLLQAVEGSVPAAILLALLGIGAARRARRTIALTLGRAGGEGSARAGRLLALLGLYVGCSGAIALGFFALLRLNS
jgi:hypothetical protein